MWAPKHVTDKGGVFDRPNDDPLVFPHPNKKIIPSRIVEWSIIAGRIAQPVEFGVTHRIGNGRCGPRWPRYAMQSPATSEWLLPEQANGSGYGHGKSKFLIHWTTCATL